MPAATAFLGIALRVYTETMVIVIANNDDVVVLTDDYYDDDLLLLLYKYHIMCFLCTFFFLIK